MIDRFRSLFWLMSVLVVSAIATSGPFNGIGSLLWAETPKVLSDPPSLKAGDPLSARTLVQKPVPLKDVLSWSIETKRHRGYVTIAVLSPDEKWIATGGLDGIVRVWDTSNGEFVRALVGHGYYTYGVAWSPDGSYLATAGSYDYLVRIWDTTTWQPVRQMKGFEGYTHHLAWSPDGRTLTVAGGSPSGYLWSWDVDKTSPRQKIGTGTYTYGIAWSPDSVSTKLAAASAAGAIVLYDGDSEKYEHQFELPDLMGYAVAWSPDGKLLAGSGNSPVMIWDVASKEKKHELPTASATVLAWSPDGQTVAAGFGGGVAFWKSPFTDKQASQTAPHYVRSILWTKDSQSAYLVETARIVKWSLPEKKAVATFDIGGDIYVNWIPGRPLVSGLHSATPQLWDPATGKTIAKLAHDGGVSAAVWSRDGKQLATTAADKKVRIWDPTGKLARTLEGHEGPVTCAAWGNSGTLATGSSDKTVRIWDVPEKGEKPDKEADKGTNKATDKGAEKANEKTAAKGPADKTRVLKKHTEPLTALAWSRDGRMLASGASGKETQVFIWANDNDKPSAEIASPAVQSLTWAPNGKLLAVGQVKGDVDFFAFPGGKKVQTYELGGSPPNVNSLAFTADGNILMSGRGDHRFQIWKGTDTKPVHNVASMSPVINAVWCADNKTAAISGHDRTVRIYDAPTATLEGVIVVEPNQLAVVSTTGHFKVPNESETELVYVIQTSKGQETLAPREFANRFKWKNIPTNAKLPSK